MDPPTSGACRRTAVPSCARYGRHPSGRRSIFRASRASSVTGAASCHGRRWCVSRHRGSCGGSTTMGTVIRAGLKRVADRYRG